MEVAWILLLLASYRTTSANTFGETPLPHVLSTSLPTDRKSVVLKGESQTENVQLLSPVTLELDCTWAGNEKKLPNITGYWTKDGEEIEDSQLTVPLENQQYNLKRVFSIVSEKHLGRYSCIFASQAKIHFVLAVPELDHVHDKPHISYTGDSVALVCKMKESAPKPDTWQWYRANGTDKVLIDALTEPQRYEIERDAHKTTLRVYNLTEEDSGLYHCGAVYSLKTTMGQLKVKVITFLEPLKILFAILAEVVLLVAAILLFEKWSKRKNENGETAVSTNETMQEESNSVEEGSALRQRKV